MIRKLPYSRMNVDWNNIQKLRDEEYSYLKYGRKRAYHNETFSHHMKANLSEYRNAIFDNGQPNKAFQKDAIDMLNEIDFVNLIYMDPPYPSTMNNYTGFYGAFDKLFNKEQMYRDLTKKELFLDNLRDIIKIAVKKTDYIVFSLNSRSNPSIADIEQIFSEYGKTTVISRKHNYQLSGKDTKNQNLEMLAMLKVERDKDGG